MLKRTPLYGEHIKLNAKMVEYAGYELPVQYSGIVDEHLAVRSKAGIFDVSHMGEILVQNENALNLVNYIICNDVTNLGIGRIRYSPMLNDDGGIVDDILIYHLDENEYLLVVNAANQDKDYEWIVKHNKFNADVTNISSKISQIAIQGPNSESILKSMNIELPIKYYSFIFSNIEDSKVLISRTGYTGEDGFEIYLKNEDASRIFELVLEGGKEFGLVPCGLGARDTLRLEASMPLYGDEMSDDISPLDTGLDRYVKFEKEDFIGKDKLKDSNKTRVGIKVIDKGIVREHSDVYKDDIKVGFTTSGTYLPYLKNAYAMAIVDKSINVGDIVYCEVRNRKLKCEIVELPFYKR